MKKKKLALSVTNTGQSPYILRVRLIGFVFATWLPPPVYLQPAASYSLNCTEQYKLIWYPSKFVMDRAQIVKSAISDD